MKVLFVDNNCFLQTLKITEVEYLAVIGLDHFFDGLYPLHLDIAGYHVHNKITEFRDIVMRKYGDVNRDQSDSFLRHCPICHPIPSTRQPKIGKKHQLLRLAAQPSDRIDSGTVEPQIDLVIAEPGNNHESAQRMMAAATTTTVVSTAAAVVVEPPVVDVQPAAAPTGDEESALILLGPPEILDDAATQLLRQRVVARDQATFGVPGGGADDAEEEANNRIPRSGRRGNVARVVQDAMPAVVPEGDGGVRITRRSGAAAVLLTTGVETQPSPPHVVQKRQGTLPRRATTLPAPAAAGESNQLQMVSKKSAPKRKR